jgi:GT2 family glycosyltransferase
MIDAHSGLAVSVVVPTYRRPDLLRRCLAALQRQSLPADAYEIIVCDDGPSDETAELVVDMSASTATSTVRPAAMAGAAARDAVADITAAGTVADMAAADARPNPTIHYVAVRDTRGPAGARNSGWRAARAPIVAFTDDDTIPDRDWLAAGLAAMATGIDAVGGRIVMPLPDSPTDYQRDATRLQDAEFATANVFVRRAALQRIGGFDTRYTMAWREDSDLHFSLLEHGFRVGAAPHAVVVHPVRPAPFGVGVKAQRKIMFDTLLYKKHPRLYRERIRPGLPWLYLGITVLLLAALVLAALHSPRGAAACAALWLALTLVFCAKRLRGNRMDLAHLAEMLLTSIAIPPLSIFWRIVASLRYRAGFP